MDAIANVLELDLSSLIFSLFILMSGTISLAAMIGKFSEMIGKPVSWIAKRNEECQGNQRIVSKARGSRQAIHPA